jgi:thiamine-monophosphate kinase
MAKSAAPQVTGTNRVVEQYWRPEPRVRLGMWLGRNRAASACIDLSDGLADGVLRLAESSSVGIAVDAGALPIDGAVRSIFETRGGDAVRDAIAGGDDYELLFTVRRRKSRSVASCARQTGVTLTRIGTCTAERAVVLRQAGGDTPLAHTGFDHFAASRPGSPVTND